MIGSDIIDLRRGESVLPLLLTECASGMIGIQHCRSRQQIPHTHTHVHSFLYPYCNIPICLFRPSIVVRSQLPIFLPLHPYHLLPLSLQSPMYTSLVTVIDEHMYLFRYSLQSFKFTAFLVRICVARNAAEPYPCVLKFDVMTMAFLNSPHHSHGFDNYSSTKGDLTISV